jgi:hypothetical protein
VRSKWKSKLSTMLKDLRAQRESAIRESTYLGGLDAVSRSNLAECDALTPEERVSINEFFGPTSNGVLAVSQNG